MKTKEGWTIIGTPEKFGQTVPSEVKWHFAFDGRYLGVMNSVDNLNSFNDEYHWALKKNKFLKIADISDFPLLGNKETRFQEWRGAPKNRSVVIVSQPNYKDVESWARYQPNSELEILYPYVECKISQAYHCNGEPKWDATKIELNKNEIEMFRSYRNNKGEKLILIGIKKIHTKDCDGPLDKNQQPMWFYISDKIKFVGYELDLVDAGDYDADSKIEFLFWYGGYSRDGYTLYESHFEKRFDYFWSYR